MTRQIVIFLLPAAVSLFRKRVRKTVAIQAPVIQREAISVS